MRAGFGGLRLGEGGGGDPPLGRADGIRLRDDGTDPCLSAGGGFGCRPRRE